MSFDIKKQKELHGKLNEEAMVHLRGPDDQYMYYQEEEGGEEKPVAIFVVGAHSERWRRVEDKQRRRRLKPKNMTAEQAHEDVLERIVHCTMDWQGINNDGNPLPFSRGAVKMIYKEFPFVLDQVAEFINEPTNFFENSSDGQ